MKKVIKRGLKPTYLALTIGLLFLLVLAACSSSSEPADSGAGEENGNGGENGSSDAGEQITLAMSIFSSENDLFSQIFRDWAAQVEEATDGRIVFEPYYNASLVSLFDTLDAVVNGTVESGLLSAGAISGQIPATGLLEVYGAYGGRDTYQDLYKEATPILEEIFRENGVELLFWLPGATKVLMWSSGDFMIHPEDFEGKTLRTAGRWLAEQFELLGAVPVTMDPGELYLALQNGTVDGTGQTISLSNAGKLYEVASKFTLFDWSSNTVMYVVNSDVWNSLSPEDQAVIKEISEQVGLQSYVTMEEGEEAILQEILEHDVEMYELTPEEGQAILDIVDQVFDTIVAESGEQGEALNEIIQKYR